ncbi:MAG: SCO family protein [Sphingomicrobium sp.]
MTEDARPPRRNLKRVRTLLWVLVALAVAGVAALLLLPQVKSRAPQIVSAPAASSLGGPFTLVGADGKPFSSARLAGRPHTIYFGYTQCGDVCPTTLARLVKLRDQSGGDKAFDIVFVTIDPRNDGPKEVGQYAELFGSPIIGLTGSQAQIDRVKKQYGIFAEPEPMDGGHGMKMNHTATVLLFDRNGRLAGTIATDEPDSAALAKLKNAVA